MRVPVTPSYKNLLDRAYTHEGFAQLTFSLTRAPASVFGFPICIHSAFTG